MVLKCAIDKQLIITGKITQWSLVCPITAVPQANGILCLDKTKSDLENFHRASLGSPEKIEPSEMVTCPHFRVRMARFCSMAFLSVSSFCCSVVLVHTAGSVFRHTLLDTKLFTYLLVCIEFVLLVLQVLVTFFL